MVWHIITGEYPPELGGVSDYTYEIARQFVRIGDQVHVWTPATNLEGSHLEQAHVHALPRGFAWHWFRELSRGLSSQGEPRNMLIQYVPHMYGWKSMNLALCWWIFRQRKHNVVVMFHEVAFPFRRGQPLRHSLLAVVHRMMAWAVLRSVRHSFTSTDPYLALLRRLGNDRTPISLVRICSNVPMESYGSELPRANDDSRADGLFTVGVFSNFSAEVQRALEPAIGCISENPQISVALLGPGEAFQQSLVSRYRHAAGRITTTGRLHVTQVGKQMRRCNALLQLYPDGASAARGTLIGAMASGIPVITSAGPATDRLLLDSNAMLFSDGSPESIRHAVELLRENPALAREVGIRAVRLYEAFFQPSVIVSSIRNTDPGINKLVLKKAPIAALQGR